MTVPTDPPPLNPTGIRQPCNEACAAFHVLTPGRWSEFGLCGNPRSPRRGYPVRLGRECNDFRVAGKMDPESSSRA